jgi:hypothetical protein
MQVASQLQGKAAAFNSFVRHTASQQRFAQDGILISMA